MTTIKIIDATINGRRNQSTTFFFSAIKHGFKLDENPSEDWVRDNISLIKSDIILSKKSKIIIQ